MADFRFNRSQATRRGIRWWPGGALAAAAVVLCVWVQTQESWPFQQRNLITAEVAIVTGILLLLWWTFLSRAQKQLRLAVLRCSASVGSQGIYFPSWNFVGPHPSLHQHRRPRRTRLLYRLRILKIRIIPFLNSSAPSARGFCRDFVFTPIGVPIHHKWFGDDRLVRLGRASRPSVTSP